MLTDLRPPDNLIDFSRRFCSEEACAEYLFALRFPNGFVCPRCGSTTAWPGKEGRLLYQCARRHKTSVTAATLMHGTKQDLVTWFHAAYLVSTLTPGISAVQFQRQMGIRRYETAFNMLHRLRAGLVAPGREPLRGEVEIDESYVGGAEAGHPGRGAQTKVLVVLAVELIRAKTRTRGHNRVRVGRVRLQSIRDASAETLVPFVIDNVEQGAIVHTDGWAGYASLREQGFDHRPVPQGSGDDARYMPHIHRIVSNLKAWLLGTHHGAVSRKHMQAYLNEYAFRFNRRFWRGPAFHRALGLAVQTDDHPTYKTLYRAGRRGGWTHPTHSHTKSTDSSHKPVTT